MSKTNRLYTLSYFTKQAIRHGYYVEKLIDSFHYSDLRKWTVIIGQSSKILVTCYKRTPHDYYFALQLPNGNLIKVETLSMYDIAIYLDTNLLDDDLMETLSDEEEKDKKCIK
jgi:hypothetical protein